jgi:hypothetical protein
MNALRQTRTAAMNADAEHQQRIAGVVTALTSLAREALLREHAAGYEQGYEAGRRWAHETLDVVSKVDMLALLDRIQLFRQMIGTFDTRYSILGEIIADFAAALEPVPADEGDA